MDDGSGIVTAETVVLDREGQGHIVVSITGYPFHLKIRACLFK